jgi:hypothetical protein
MTFLTASSLMPEQLSRIPKDRISPAVSSLIWIETVVAPALVEFPTISRI